MSKRHNHIAKAVPATSLPDTWESAFALMAERVADRFQALDDERSREIGDLHHQVDDVRATVQQILDRLERMDQAQVARDQAQAAQASAASEARAEAAVVMDDLRGQLGAVNKALDAVEARAGAIERVQADYGTDAAARDEAVQEAAGLAQQAVRGVESVAARVHAVEARAGALETSHADHVKATAAVDARVSDLREDVAGMLTKVDEIAAAAPVLAQQIRDTAVTAGEMVDEIQATVLSVTALRDDAASKLRQVHATMSQQVATFMVNRDGHLVATRHDGEVVDLGAVCGRDGVSPVALAAVTIDGDQVRFIMSDGTEHRAQIQTAKKSPSTVTIEKPATVYGGFTVANMQKMRASGMSFAAIAKIVDITPQYVARLIRKAEKDEQA